MRGGWVRGLVALSDRRAGMLERMAQLDTAAKEPGARLAGRWELERAAQAREREQREREAGERARAQRR